MVSDMSLINSDWNANQGLITTKISRQSMSSESNDSIDDYINEILENVSFSDEEVDQQMIEIENYIKYNDILNNIKDVNENTSELSVVPLFRQIIDYNSFNDLETNRLSELSSAIMTLYYKTNDNLIELTKLSEIYELKLNAFERDINIFIQFAKQLNCFNDLCENDKLSLIKYGYYEVTNLHNKYNHRKYYCSSRPFANLELVSL